MSFDLTRTRRTAALLSAAVITAAMTWVSGGFTPTPAQALPPQGASPNTPGTDSDVQPTSLEPCDTINFAVTGFPPGEVVYIKIDDGIGYGDITQQGSGVIHRQAADSSGAASGSLDLPCTIAAGSHWLRFLSSEALLNDDGVQKGSKGYSNRSPDFTVTAATGTNANRAAEAQQEAEAASAGTAADSQAVAQAVQQATRNTRQGRTTTTRTVSAQPAGSADGAQAGAQPAAEPAAQAEAQAGAQAGAQAKPAAAAAAQNSPDAKKNARDAKAPQVLSAGNLGKQNTTGASDDGVAVAYDTTSGEVVYAAPRNQAPIIGLLVGGSILIVGFGAIAAYLYVNRRQPGEV